MGLPIFSNKHSFSFRWGGGAKGVVSRWTQDYPEIISKSMGRGGLLFLMVSIYKFGISDFWLYCHVWDHGTDVEIVYCGKFCIEIVSATI